MQEFKEIILKDEYNLNENYSITFDEVDDNYFNGRKEFKEKYIRLCNSFIDGYYSSINYRCECVAYCWRSEVDRYRRQEVNISLMLHLAYNINIEKFVKNNNGYLCCLGTDFIKDFDFKNKLHLINFNKILDNSEVMIEICVDLFRNGIDLKRIIDDRILKNVILCVSFIEPKFEKYDDFFVYLIDNFSVLQHFNLFGEFLSYFLEKCTEDGSRLRKKVDHNMDVLIFMCFNNDCRGIIGQYTEKIKFLFNGVDSMSSDRIDEESFMKSFTEYDTDILIPLEIIQMLSTLENFDDFVKNNETLLKKTLNKAALSFIECYI